MKSNILKKCAKTILTTAMIFGILLVDSLLLDASTTHSHAICGAECNGHVDESQHNDAIVFEELTADKIITAKRSNGDNVSTVNHGNYYLKQDLALNSKLYITEDTVICLNGHKLYAGPNMQDAILFVDKSKKLSICDCSEEQSGMITGGRGNYGKYSSGGTYTVVGGGIFIESNASFDLYGGNISENSADLYGGGIYINNNVTMRMYGGSVSNNILKNRTEGSGGSGIYLRNTGSKLYLYGGKISNNSGACRGGGLYIGSDNSCEMYDGAEIIGNATASTSYASGSNCGAGVYCNGNFLMYGGSIMENTTARQGFGGGLEIERTGFFTMCDGTIQKNTAKSRGGGINGFNITIKGGTITENVANLYGGGIFPEDSNLKLSGNPYISGNGNSGDIYLHNNRTFIVDGPLEKNAFIGVRQISSQKGVFAVPDGELNNLAPYVNRFTSFDEGYGVAPTEDGKLTFSDMAIIQQPNWNNKYTLSTGAQAESWQWFKEGETTDTKLTDQTTNQLKPTEAGRYYCIVTLTENNKSLELTSQRAVVEGVVNLPDTTVNRTFLYDGSEKQAITGGTGYTFTNHTGTEANDYIAIAKLAPGYIWNRNEDIMSDIEIPWSIKKATLVDVIVAQDGNLTYSGEFLSAKVKTTGKAVNKQPLSFQYRVSSEEEWLDEVPTFMNAGEYTVYYKASAPNHEDTFGEFKVTIDKANIFITADSKNVVENTAMPEFTYQVKGLYFDDKLIKAPSVFCEGNIAKPGEYEIIVSGAQINDNYKINYVSGKLKVITDDTVKAADGILNELNKFKEESVTSADKEAIQSLNEKIDSLLKKDGITVNGKKALNNAKTIAEKLIRTIEQAEESVNSESIQKVKEITADNVLVDDKEVLGKAKEDLTTILNNKSGNYTQSEKTAIQNEVNRINKLLSSIEKTLSFAKKNNISEEMLLITADSIKAQKTEENQNATYNILSARAAKVIKNKITLKWNKVKGADGYIVFGNKCGTKNKYKQIKVLKASKRTFTQSKLKKGTYYKYIVIAYKLVDGKKVTIAVSKTIYAATSGGKYGNAKSVKVNKTKVTLKKGKIFIIKASQVKADKKIKNHRAIAYESSNKKVATVTKKGKIEAIKKGTCYIYVYAQNGVYKKIKVTVKSK